MEKKTSVTCSNCILFSTIFSYLFIDLFCHSLSSSLPSNPFLLFLSATRNSILTKTSTPSIHNYLQLLSYIISILICKNISYYFHFHISLSKWIPCIHLCFLFLVFIFVYLFSFYFSSLFVRYIGFYNLSIFIDFRCKVISDVTHRIDCIFNNYWDIGTHRKSYSGT